jgi:nucleotide-binding universal stress UspA family protein
VPEIRILICYDGSEESRRGIEAAASLLGPRRAVVLDVGPTLTRTESLAAVTGELGGGEFEALNGEVALEVATEGAARARAAGFDAEPQGAVASPTWEGIVETADEIDAALIVIGSRGHESLRGRLEPSTSHDLAVHAGRPVLIVPRPELVGEKGD